MEGYILQWMDKAKVKGEMSCSGKSPKGKARFIPSLLLSMGTPFHLAMHCLVGLVVKASTSRAEDPEFESRLRQDFFRVESYK